MHILIIWIYTYTAQSSEQIMKKNKKKKANANRNAMFLKKTKRYTRCITRLSKALTKPIPSASYPAYFKAKAATHADMLSEFSLSCFHSYIRSGREGEKREDKSPFCFSVTQR